MRKKYNTLNEEINRMKSLFGESRLYGNLVDNQEENIISEQYKFLQKLKNLGKIKLKNLEDLKVLENFQNMKIWNFGDIIKHVDEFQGMWKILNPKWDFDQAKLVLKDLKESVENGQIKNIPEDVFIRDVLPVFPHKGGMYDMVYDMYLVANGKSRLLPAAVETRIVKVNKSGDIVITNGKGVELQKIGRYDAESGKFDADFEGDVTLKDGEWVDADGNPINKKIDKDWEEGMIVYGDDGYEIGTYNSRGEIIDVHGNHVDGNGKIITKASDMIPEAQLVKDVPVGSTMGDLNGKSVKDTPENNSRINNATNEEITNGGVKVVETNSEVGELKSQIGKMESELEDLRKSVSDTKDKLSAEQIKTRDGKIKELEDKLDDLKNKSGDEATEVDVNITDEQTNYASEQLVKELRWDKKFSNWFVKYLLPLKITGDETVLVRRLKQTGSSTVDPLGLINWMREYKPRVIDGVQMQHKSVKWRKFYRTLSGSAFNILFWNFLLYHMGSRVFGVESGKKYSITNIIPTYWENIKYNWITKGAGFLISLWATGEMDSFCEELEENTKHDCDWWSDAWKDYIQERMEEKFKNKSCSDMQEYFEKNGAVKEEKYDELAKEISEKWNKKLKDATGIGFFEKWVEKIMGWQTELTDIGVEVFKNHTVEVDDGQGGKAKFNAIEFYLNSKTMEACGGKMEEKSGGDSDDEKTTETVNA
tara:strand:+ start:6010 stop:8127 length:2118 start_codon:yes stop_codon:yes gene_type:complete